MIAAIQNQRKLRYLRGARASVLADGAPLPTGASVDSPATESSLVVVTGLTVRSNGGGDGLVARTARR